MTRGPLNTSLFFFGFGYVAQRLSSFLQDWHMEGTSRTPRAAPIVLHPYTEHQTPPDHVLERFSHFLISIPPTSSGDLVLERYASFFARFSSKRHRDIEPQSKRPWIGYLSATNVYGDYKGDWVTETSVTNPSSPLGQKRLLAENQWLNLAKTHNISLVIFRLSGIYGPGRSAIEAIRAGKGRIIEKEGQVFSRCHVDDICHVVRKSLLMDSAQDSEPIIYNVADDHPCSSGEVFRYAYKILGIRPPEPISVAQLSPGALQFYGESKRVSNERVKKDLNIALQYPTYREGLLSILGHTSPHTKPDF